VFAGTSCHGRRISYENINAAGTHGVTWVDVTVVVESGRFLLCSRVVFVVAIHGLRNEYVPDRTDTLFELGVKRCSEIQQLQPSLCIYCAY